MTKLFIGADVSKGYADFVVLSGSYDLIEPPFRLDDTIKGHVALKGVLVRLIKKFPDAEFYAAVESTGGFENNWLTALYQLSQILPLKSARVNARGVKHYSQAELTRTVTDETSAFAIAGYMIAHPNKILYDQDDSFYTIRKQWNAACLLKKISTQLLNSLQMLLYTANPGVLIYCRHGIPTWLLNVLNRYPTASQLSRARIQTLGAMKHVGTEKANALIRYAKSDVASTVDEYTGNTIKQMICQILSTEASIKALENQLIKKYQNDPQVVLLSSIKGIGVISAIGILTNIRDINLFSEVKQLAAYFGLHPIWRESGDGAFGFHMSKQGRVQPRKILFLCTLCGITHNPTIKTLYIDSLKKGMPKMAAIGKCMHKMLRIIYGILKSGKPFDPEIDQKNVKQFSSGSAEAKKAHEEKVRRYQSTDNNAPVSGWQAKKRKRSNGSQNKIIVEYGISTPLNENISNGRLLQSVERN